MQYIGKHCSTVQINAVHYIAPECIAVQCSVYLKNSCPHSQLEALDMQCLDRNN